MPGSLQMPVLPASPTKNSQDPTVLSKTPVPLSQQLTRMTPEGFCSQHSSVRWHFSLPCRRDHAEGLQGRHERGPCSGSVLRAAFKRRKVEGPHLHGPAARSHAVASSSHEFQETSVTCTLVDTLRWEPGRYGTADSCQLFSGCTPGRQCVHRVAMPPAR